MTTLPPLKLVVFDMAGTTVHDEDFVNLAFQQAMKNGADLTVTRAEINDVMGMRKPDAIRTVLQLRRGPGAEVSVAEVNSLHGLFLAEMLSFYRHDPRVREIHGVSELFAALRAKGIRVALDSGFSRGVFSFSKSPPFFLNQTYFSFLLFSSHLFVVVVVD
ncbi:MAG: hypothetical protein Q8P67_14410 [archaeon]|nr:hypothetical protein [archaeon]